MKLIKCPRCELNYITENEKICSVCKRDVKGEVEQDDLVELCSECGEHPAMPGQEICIYCFKEMQRRSEASSTDDNGGMEPGGNQPQHRSRQHDGRNRHRAARFV